MVNVYMDVVPGKCPICDHEAMITYEFFCGIQTMRCNHCNQLYIEHNYFDCLVKCTRKAIAIMTEITPEHPDYEIYKPEINDMRRFLQLREYFNGVIYDKKYNLFLDKRIYG